MSSEFFNDSPGVDVMAAMPTEPQETKIMSKSKGPKGYARKDIKSDHIPNAKISANELVSFIDKNKHKLGTLSMKRAIFKRWPDCGAIFSVKAGCYLVFTMGGKSYTIDKPTRANKIIVKNKSSKQD